MMYLFVKVKFIKNIIIINNVLHDNPDRWVRRNNSYRNK